MSNDTLFEFPCEFPIKVMGEDVPEFHLNVRKIINNHLQNIPASAFKTRLSKNGKYVSLTITFTATSKQQLDNIYLDLNACRYVNMCL